MINIRVGCYFGAFLVISGCAISTEHSSVLPGVDLSQHKVLFVVKDQDDRRNVAEEISERLIELGYQSSVGQESDSPESADIVVRYLATWRWDVVIYLATLNIRFHDPESQMTLASGTSEHRGMHHWTKRKMVEEVLTNIFEGKDDSFRNDYFEEILAEQMVVNPVVTVDTSLPISTEVIGYGSQLSSDKAFDEALTTSLQNHGIFRSISDDGEYRLVVSLHGLITDETHLVVLGYVIFHNVEATATWALIEKATGAVSYNSEIITSCPEEKLDDSKGVSGKAACAIRENIASGIREIGSLQIDQT